MRPCVLPVTSISPLFLSRNREKEIAAADVERAFDNYDTQKKGVLGQKELDCVLDDLGYSAAEKQDVFFALDIDGDGTVSREEFCVNTSQTAAEKEFYRRLFGYLRSQRGEDNFSDPWPGEVGSLEES